MAGEDIQNHHGQGAVPVASTCAGIGAFVPRRHNHRSAGDIQTLKTIPVAHFPVAF